jgi:hypothetical protein
MTATSRCHGEGDNGTMPLKAAVLALLAGAALIATMALTTPPAGANVAKVRLFSPDPPGLSGGPLGRVLGPDCNCINPGIAVTPDGETAAYVQGDKLVRSLDGKTEVAGVGPNGYASSGGCRGEHTDCHHLISPDGKRVVFETRDSLVNEDADSCPEWFVGRGCVDIYERVGNVTRLLSTADPVGGNGPFDASLGSLSRDGSRVFFHLDASRCVGNQCRPPRGAWERAGATVSPFPSADNQASWAEVEGEGASRDGRRVFFSTNDSLVPEDGDGGRDVYERRRDGTVSLVSTSPLSANESVLARFAGASDDGSRVFFSTSEKLVPEDTDDGCYNGGAARGCPDLYERSNGIVRLVSAGPGGGGPNTGVDVSRVKISPDGRAFFETYEPLLAEDTDGNQDVYESRDGALRMLSNGLAGNVSLAGISEDGSHVFLASETWDIYEHVGNTTRLVVSDASFNGSSEDGKRVFFTTGEPLVPEAQECVHRVGYPCPDVYEQFNGTTTLLSPDTVNCFPGVDSGEDCPRFVAASRDGKRVFFTTNESLDPADTDTYNDLYVATVPNHGCRSQKHGKRHKRCAG